MRPISPTPSHRNHLLNHPSNQPLKTRFKASLKSSRNILGCPNWAVASRNEEGRLAMFHEGAITWSGWSHVISRLGQPNRKSDYCPIFDHVTCLYKTSGFITQWALHRKYRLYARLDILSKAIFWTFKKAAVCVPNTRKGVSKTSNLSPPEFPALWAV